MVLITRILMKRRPRTVWKKLASTGWWTVVNNGLFREAWWKESLRMTRETFVVLCDNLRLRITEKVTRFRQPVSVEKRVAITI